MSKPYIHAKSSARKYGGIPEDYLDIHQFMDSSKASLADVRHRALLHSSFGCFVAERVFGVVRKNTDDKEYSVRDVAEDHCMEDLGFIPSVEKWLGNMTIQTWMGGPCNKNDREKKFFVPMNELKPSTYAGANSSVSTGGSFDISKFKENGLYADGPAKMEYYDGSIRVEGRGTLVEKLPEVLYDEAYTDGVRKLPEDTKSNR